MNIYSSSTYDYLPEHILWSINGRMFHSPIFFLNQGLPLDSFSYQYQIPKGLKLLSWRQECLRAAERILEKFPNQKIAVCISGSDSEIAARSFKLCGAAIELWHLKYWTDEDNFILDKAKKLSEDLSCPLNIVEINRDQAHNQVTKSCTTVGVIAGGYYANTFLLEQVPRDHFAIIAEGDFEKRGSTYRFVLDFHKSPFDTKVLPIHPTEILYRVWAQAHQRPGCYYFFSSTPELILSTAQHPDLEQFTPNQQDPRVWSVMQLKLNEWPELLFREPTKPFHNANSVRIELIELCKQTFEQKQWLCLVDEFKFSSVIPLDCYETYR